MISGVTIECTSADETLAVLVVTPTFESEPTTGRSFAGVIRGPFCDRARTLPAEFTLRSNDDGTLTATIVDPCYSTGELKMEFEMEVWCEQDGARSAKFTTLVELKKK